MGNASVCVNSEFLGDEVGRKGVDVLIDTLEGGRELPQEWSDRDDDDEDQEKVTPDEPGEGGTCLLYTSPSPRDQRGSRMPSSA